MKFKNWLVNLEESGNLRNRSTSGNMDMTRGLGPTSQYGHSAMMPISMGIDNRAAAGVIDGVGSARAKIRARKGAEPGVASQYHMWDELRKDGMTVIYMPLQLPNEDSGLDRSPLTNTKGLVQILKAQGDPLKNPHVWRVDPESNIRLLGQASGREPNRLFYTEAQTRLDSQRYNDAKEFTTALMFASIAVRLDDYAHRLNIEKPYIKDQKIEAVPFDDGQEKHKRVVYYVMMCSFVLKSRHKDQEIDGTLRDEIERVLAGENPRTHPTNKPTSLNATGSLPGTSDITVTA